MIPKSNERCVFVGPTGSGKTELARVMLRGRKNVVVVDPKHQWKVDKGDLVAKSLQQLRRALNRARKTGQRVVYRVPREHLLPQNSMFLDEVAKIALERKNTLLYYDEVVFVANGSDFTRRAPHFYFAITTGRSSGVGVFMSCQRPAWVPLIVFTESEYRATFYLRNAGDRERMEAVMGEDIPWDTLRENRYAFCMADDLETTQPHRLQFLPRAA